MCTVRCLPRPRALRAKVSTLRPPRKRAVHTRAGCSSCPASGGPCCIETDASNANSGTGIANVAGREDELEEEEDDEAALQNALAAAVDAGGADAEAVIMAVEAASGNDELELLLIDHMGMPHD